MRGQGWRAVLLVILATGLGASTCQSGNPLDPDNACGLLAGSVEGEPRITMGSGSRTFVEIPQDGRWLAGYGQQGGYHLWLSLRTQGLGPSVEVAYRMTEVDGGLITEGSEFLCLNPSTTGSGQEVTGILAFIPDSNHVHESCSRILCGGPFNFTATVTGDDGKSASETRFVPGTDEGETEEARTRLPCGDAGPVPECPADAGR
ncbi:MAG: hypothetical protein AB2A00_40070 [Myxococcota bacterium]